MPAPADEDREWLRRALALAQRGWGRVAPNPLVGCVLVRDGAVVGEGWHTEYGLPHAEVEALRAAGDAARGATAYVSLEPCAHHGKTPPCTKALAEAGVARVVFAAADPNPKARGGAEVLREAGIAVSGPLLEREGRDASPAFFHRHGPEGDARPMVTLKLALSLDARVADRDGNSVWITGEEARAEVHRMRAGHDAVAVGIGTALADDPLLTVRGDVTPRILPVRVVFDRRLRLPLDAHLARTAAETPTWVVAGEEAPPERAAALSAAGVRVLRAPSLADGLGALRAEGIGSLFCEGGGALASALLEAGVVDRLHIFYAPLLLGPAGRGAFDGVGSPPIGDAARWRRVESRALGADTLITLAPS